MDDGSTDDFFTILLTESETSLMIYDTIVDNYYKFRYRVKNKVGWSEYSDVSYL